MRTIAMDAYFFNELKSHPVFPFGELAPFCSVN